MSVPYAVDLSDRDCALLLGTINATFHFAPPKGEDARRINELRAEFARKALAGPKKEGP